MRDGEEVVTGDAEVDVRRAFEVHRPVEDADVVDVGRLLGVPGREVPSADLGFDAFHREVRALDDADLDGGSAARPARSAHSWRSFIASSVGQVGLEDDAGGPRRSSRSRIFLKTSTVRWRSWYSSMSRLMNLPPALAAYW